MIRSRTDVLLLPSDELELAVRAEFVGREVDWTDSAASALAELEQALRQHVALAEGDEGIYCMVNLDRPTVIRQVHRLRRQHLDLLADVGLLQEMVRNAALVFQPRCGPAWLDNIYDSDVRRGVPDFGAIRERAERFLQQLEAHEEEEDLLIMDCVSTDLGTGD